MSADQPMPAQEGANSALEAVSFLDSLSSIEWIDWTAIVLLGVFFLLGLFKGLVWQVSRILSIVAAWLLAGQFGPQGEALLARWFDPATSPAELPLFLSYVIIFVVALVVLSLIAWGLQKLVKKTGLTFYDRISGALLGLGTGAAGVVVILAGIYMFVPSDLGLVQAAQRSRSMQFSQKAMELLGESVPEPMRKIFGVPKSGAGAAGRGASQGK